MADLIYFVLFLLFSITEAQKIRVEEQITCSYHGVNESQVQHVDLGSGVEGRTSRKGNLRIAIIYDNSVEALSQELKDVLKNKIVPVGKKFWEDSLVVNQLSTPIQLKRACKDGYFSPDTGCCSKGCLKETNCGEMVVPDDHLMPCHECSNNKPEPDNSRGVKDADFVLYVSAKNTETCQRGSAAHAIHCAQESKLDRPIAGNANFCPNKIAKEEYEIESSIATMEHEVLHALAFTPYLFPYFRDENGEPRLKNSGQRKPKEAEGIIYKPYEREWKVRGGKNLKKTVYLVVTPKVVEEVRKYFGCDNLEGAELEDQGEAGTKWSHWEKRIFNDEAMSGIHTRTANFSRITFALLEDSGWYEPNYDLISSPSWGKGLGCDFATKSCKAWMDDRTNRGEGPDPYCNEPSEDFRCTFDRSALGNCLIVDHGVKLKEIYQYFDSLKGVDPNALDRYGGKTVLADYCPVFEQIVLRDGGTFRSTNCDNANNQGDPKILEFFGPGSQCFDFDEKWTRIETESSGLTTNERTYTSNQMAGCYKTECKNGRLIVILEGEEWPCIHTGQKLPIVVKPKDNVEVRGSIICPDCHQACPDIACQAGTKEDAENYEYPNSEAIRVNFSASIIIIINIILLVLQVK